MKEELCSLIQQYPLLFETNNKEPLQLRFVRKVILDVEKKPTDLFALFRLKRDMQKSMGDLPSLAATVREVEAYITTTYLSDHDEYSIATIKQTMPYLDTAPIRDIVFEWLDGDMKRTDQIMDYLDSKKIKTVIDFLYERPENHQQSTYKDVLEKITQYIIDKRKGWL